MNHESLLCRISSEPLDDSAAPKGASLKSGSYCATAATVQKQVVGSHCAMAATGGYAGTGTTAGTAGPGLLKFVKLSGEEIPCHLALQLYLEEHPD